ncbi:MAG: VOC family protein [Pyrinomonadaceae bacterium]
MQIGINSQKGEAEQMNPGYFSISLAVKDIQKSKEFYEGFGFKAVDGCGSVEEKWLMLENGDAKIGLFEGMFEQNLITFNPKNGRKFFRAAKEIGAQILYQSQDIEEEGNGACSFSMIDPDGNQILVDQF